MTSHNGIVEVRATTEELSGWRSFEQRTDPIALATMVDLVSDGRRGGAMYHLYSPEDILAAGRPFYVGYMAQRKAGVFVGRCVDDTKQPYSLLLVGLPGTGKSRYPHVLAYDLCQVGLKYHLLWIPCGSYAAQYDPREVLGHLQDIKARAMDGSERLIVVLDELDAVATDRGELASGMTVSHWTLATIRSLLDGEAQRLVFGISNYPSQLDRAIFNEVAAAMYFDTPTDAQAAGLLAHEKLPNPLEIAQHYRRLCDDMACTFTGRSLQHAVNRIRLLFDGEWQSYTSEQWARALEAQGGRLPKKSKEEYEEDNSAVIRPARGLAESLEARYNQLVQQNKLQDLDDPGDQFATLVAKEG